MLLNCGAREDFQSPLDCKEIKWVNPKGNQPWIVIGRTDAEAEAPVLWPPDLKSQLIWKDPDVGNFEGRNRRGWQRMRWLNVITESMDMSLSKLWEMVKEREVWHAAAHGVIKSQTWLSNWTTTLSYTRAVKCVLSMNSNMRSFPNSMISIYIISLQNTYIYIFIKEVLFS